ncbi:hypothetical protein CROQUDRAFT_92976 [Cronartium quercuum f. sp. fusiforme G11]|uniref:Uncharacterized protein n=1 Tax=Cronartium quercuum f. sp. fusiforme G11 TaxID=708437 RepID=A0A9P6NMH6_9BASI|nr:hypothetical protein CROQUDRAFT_92976 [Cronartium quercuum f. sp. fusiforme G11]
MSELNHHPKKSNEDKKPIDRTESEPLIPQAGPSTTTNNPTTADRPRTVRHHRRTLSGRSVRSGHFQFGPSYHPNIYPTVNDPFTRQSKRAADARARSRFFKSLLLGVGLWIVIGLVLGWTGWQESGWGNNNHRLNYGAKPEIPQNEGHVIACANFTTASSLPGNNLRSEANFAFKNRRHQPQSLFIHSKGSFAKGRIMIGLIDDEQEEEGEISEEKSVKVEIIALFNDEALIDLMNICEVSKRSENEELGRQAGLAIYTPSPEVGPYPDSDLEFRINILIPKSISSLEIRSDLFSIKTDDLSFIKFNTIDFGTTVGSITIENVWSHAIRIRTNNGHVEGVFNVSKSLSLATTNGAINAQVALFPLTKKDQDLPDLPPNPPSRGLPSSTTNLSTSVHATTTNGAVVLQYIHHPIDQTLFSFVSSTNGKASVEHTPSFEGDFEAETVWGSATVKGPKSNRDPKGLNRQRKKVIRTDRDELGYRHISGSVWWDGDEGIKKGKGDSVVKTTLGAAQIVFD